MFKKFKILTIKIIVTKNVIADDGLKVHQKIYF